MLVSKLNLDPGENIILEVRKHWFVFAFSSLGILLGAIAPLLFFIVIKNFLTGSIFSSSIIDLILFHKAMAISLYFLWLLLFWVMFFVEWTNYYLDVWHITEKRIIDIEQKSLFHREVSNLRFDKIQDISIEVDGIIPTFLNFGNIRVQTAAENSKSFQIKNAANPENARQTIFSHHNKQAEK